MKAEAAATLSHKALVPIWMGQSKWGLFLSHSLSTPQVFFYKHNLEFLLIIKIINFFIYVNDLK